MFQINLYVKIWAVLLWQQNSITIFDNQQIWGSAVKSDLFLLLAVH